VTSLSLVMTFLVIHYIRVQNFFSQNGLYGFKIRCRILHRFQNINLPFWQSAPKKSYSRKKNYFTTQGCTEVNHYPRISFFRCILSPR
jgi:hypothetical protein